MRLASGRRVHPVHVFLVIFLKIIDGRRRLLGDRGGVGARETSAKGAPAQAPGSAAVRVPAAPPARVALFEEDRQMK